MRRMVEVGESSSVLPTSTAEKPIIVRVKRKPDQSPLQALWLQINERPPKRPLIDFQKLSISASSLPEDLKTRRVLVQHVETLHSSQDTLGFMNSFVQPSSGGDTNKPSSNERRCSLQKVKKLDHLLSKAKQEHEDMARTARFEQVWKRRRGKEASGSLDGVCRVYDVLQLDMEETVTTLKQQEEISAEDQKILYKFLPLLRDYIPSAAKEIESDMHSYALRRDSADEYVYDLYAAKENVDEAEACYLFPLVQVDDDDEFYDGPDYSDYESDDSNAENNPSNDYPDEESTNDEERSEESGSESQEDGSETENDTWTKSDNSEGPDRLEDPLYEDDLHDDPNYADCDDVDAENWRWAYR